MSEYQPKELPRGLTLLQTMRIELEDCYFETLDWSPDGRYLAANVESDNARVDGFLRIYQIGTDEYVDLVPDDSDYISCHAWSPDGKYLVMGGSDLHIVDMLTRQEIRLINIDIIDQEESVLFATWTPDGKRIVTGGDRHRYGGGPIHILDAHTGERLHEMIHGSSVNSFALAPDGKTLATAGWPNVDNIRFWDVQTGECVDQLRIQGRVVRDCLFSPDGTLFATAYRDGFIGLWDMNLGVQTHLLAGHTGELRSIAFSANGRWMISDSADGTVRMWRCDTWETVAVIPVVHGNQTSTEVKFHPTQPIIAIHDDEDSAIHLIEFNEETLFSLPSIC